MVSIGSDVLLWGILCGDDGVGKCSLEVTFHLGRDSFNSRDSFDICKDIIGSHEYEDSKGKGKLIQVSKFLSRFGLSQQSSLRWMGRTTR